MNEVKLNETPVRTARNFNINNIRLNDIKYIENLKKFENIEIKNLSSGVKMDDNISDYSLKYGVLKELEDEIKFKANSKLKVDISGNANFQIINSFDENNLNLVDDIEIIANTDCFADIIIKYTRKL